MFARTVFVSLVVMQNTTPSGCACHPSAGEELLVRYFFNSPTTHFHRKGIVRPDGFREFSGYAEHHPVRLRRRVQTRYDCSSVSVLVISPPQEGNDLPLQLNRRLYSAPTKAAPIKQSRNHLHTWLLCLLLTSP